MIPNQVMVIQMFTLIISQFVSFIRIPLSNFVRHSLFITDCYPIKIKLNLYLSVTKINLPISSLLIRTDRSFTHLPIYFLWSWVGIFLSDNILNV